MRAATVSGPSVMIDRDYMADFLPPKKQPKLAEKENQHTSEGSVKLRGKVSLLLIESEGQEEVKNRFGDTICGKAYQLIKGICTSVHREDHAVGHASSGKWLDVFGEISFSINYFKHPVILVHFYTGYPFCK